MPCQTPREAEPTYRACKVTAKSKHSRFTDKWQSLVPAQISPPAGAERLSILALARRLSPRGAYLNFIEMVYRGTYTRNPKPTNPMFRTFRCPNFTTPPRPRTLPVLLGILSPRCDVMKAWGGGRGFRAWSLGSRVWGFRMAFCRLGRT